MNKKYENFCRYCGLELGSEICRERNNAAEGEQCTVPVGCLLVMDERKRRK